MKTLLYVGLPNDSCAEIDWPLSDIPRNGDKVCVTIREVGYIVTIDEVIWHPRFEPEPYVWVGGEAVLDDGGEPPCCGPA